MKKGGYQILDLRNTAITSGTETVIPGVYDQVSRSNGKRVVVSGLVAGDTLYSDFDAYFTESSGAYSASATVGESTVELSIETGDAITVTIS